MLGEIVGPLIIPSKVALAAVLLCRNIFLSASVMLPSMMYLVVLPCKPVWNVCCLVTEVLYGFGFLSFASERVMADRSSSSLLRLWACFMQILLPQNLAASECFESLCYYGSLLAFYFILSLPGLYHLFFLLFFSPQVHSAYSAVDICCWKRFKMFFGKE